MAFGAALAGLAGYGEGKVNRFKDDRAQSNADRLYEEQKRADDASIAQQQAAQKKSQRETDTADANLAKNAAFRQKMKLPTNWTKMKPEEKTAYLEQTYRAAQSAGATDVMTETLAFLNAIPKTADAYSKIEHRGAQDDKLYSDIELNKAKAWGIHALDARAKSIAAGHDAATLNRVNKEILARQELAEFNADVKGHLVELAAKFRLQNQSAEDAVKMAIATFNGGVQEWKVQNAPAAGALQSPGYGGAQPTMQQPGTTVNVYPGGGDNGGGSGFNGRFVNGRYVMGGGDNSGNQGGGGGANTQRGIALDSEIKRLKDGGFPLTDPRTREALKKDGFTDAEIDAKTRVSAPAAPANNGKLQPLPPGGMKQVLQGGGGSPQLPF